MFFNMGPSSLTPLSDKLLVSSYAETTPHLPGCENLDLQNVQKLSTCKHFV